MPSPSTVGSPKATSDSAMREPAKAPVSLHKASGNDHKSRHSSQPVPSAGSRVPSVASASPAFVGTPDPSHRAAKASGNAHKSRQSSHPVSPASSGVPSVANASPALVGTPDPSRSVAPSNDAVLVASRVPLEAAAYRKELPKKATETRPVGIMTPSGRTDAAQLCQKGARITLPKRQSGGTSSSGRAESHTTSKESGTLDHMRTVTFDMAAIENVTGEMLLHTGRHVKRPEELPFLRLRRLSLAPLRIIGLLRPRTTRQRKQPTLRELLLEAQNKEQDELNRYTKERERQMLVVVVVALLFVYYAAMATAFYYYEQGDIVSNTPGVRRVPMELLRSTVNGSSDDAASSHP